MGSFRTNQRALRKQGWAFTYSRCFQRVTFRNKHSDDSGQKLYRIIFKHLQKSTENYVHGITFGKLYKITFREKHSQKHSEHCLEKNNNIF